MKGEGEGKRGGRKRKEIGEGKRMLEGGQGVWFSISKATQTVWRGMGGNAKTKKQKTKNPPEQNKARGGKGGGFHVRQFVKVFRRNAKRQRREQQVRISQPTTTKTTGEEQAAASSEESKQTKQQGRRVADKEVARLLQTKRKGVDRGRAAQRAVIWTSTERSSPSFVAWVASYSPSTLTSCKGAYFAMFTRVKS